MLLIPPRLTFVLSLIHICVLREQDEDLRSLKELIVYGLKGMAAYLEHAMRLGFNDDTVHVFMQRALATICLLYTSRCV